MNLASFIPTERIQVVARRDGHLDRRGMLGAIDDVDKEATAAYLRGVRNQLVGSWNEAVEAYTALRTVRGTLGLPFVATPEQAVTDPDNALLPSEQQLFLEMAAIMPAMTQIADDALADRRKVAFDAMQGFLIEQLPGDNVKIEARGGRPVVIDSATGQPVTVTGTIGIAPAIVIVAIVAVAVYFTANKVCDTLKVTAQEKTMRTLGKSGDKLVKEGKASPDQVTNMRSALFTGAKDLELARAEVEKAKGVGGLGDTLKTVAWVGFGIVAVFALIQILPALVATRKAVTV